MAKKSLKPLKTPVQKRSRETVEVILKASVHILNKQGWDSFTTRNIADQAGISYGSLYQYFPHRESILRSLTLSVLNQDIEELHSLVFEFEKTNNARLTLQLLVHRIVEWHQQDLRLRTIIYQKISELNLGAEVFKAQQQLIMLFQQLVEKIKGPVKHKKAQGGVNSPASVAVLFYAVLGVCHAMEALEQIISPQDLEQSLLQLICRFLDLEKDVRR